MDAIVVLNNVVNLLMDDSIELAKKAKQEENIYTKSSLLDRAATLQLVSRTIQKALKATD